ncbi:MAG: FtsX-like permease family protein [Anaerovoracaceae bacterium]
MAKLDLMLLRMIKNSKSQFLAVLIIIVVGICVYTSMNMASDNLGHTLDSYYEENRFPDLFVQVMGVPVQETERLQGIAGVSDVSGTLTMDVPVLSADTERRKTLRLYTTKGDPRELSGSILLEGRPLSQGRKEIWLISQYAKANGIVPGDEIRIQVSGMDHTLTVVGVVANPEFIYLIENAQSIMPDESNFGVGYLSEATGRMIMGEGQNYNYIRIEYEPGVDEEILTEAVEEQLKPYGINSVTKRENQLSNAIMQEELNSLTMMSDSLPFLFLFTAGFILVMILSRMVKNDRLKVGVLKAIGYGNKPILLHYTKYAIVVGIIGGLLGSSLGMALAGAMTKLYLEFFNLPLLRLEFDITYIFTAILLTALFCVVSGIIGARGVLKIAPSDSMREEPPKKGKRILLERAPFVWKRFSFSRKLVMKNIFRNKKRTIFVITGVTLTYGMMMFTVTMPEVVDQLMNQHFTEFQRMDYNIGFYKPTDESAVGDLYHLIDIDYAEGKVEFPFELSRGHKKQSVNILGLEKDTRFYSFKDAGDKPVYVREGGILLSENLAKSLNVGTGDNIQIKSFLTEKTELDLPVAGVIKQSLGMNAYMEIDEMRKRLLEEGMVTGVFLDSGDDAISEKLLKAANIASVMSTQDMRDVYEEYMELIIVSIGFMLFFSGIIGFCIVYISTMISISEREGEFSSLRVLGFTKMEIFRMIRRENNMITVIGILAGIPVGWMFCKYSSEVFSTDIYSLDMMPTLGTAIWAGVFTVGFVVLAQLATYRKIRKLDFLQALKNRAG